MLKWVLRALVMPVMFFGIAYAACPTFPYPFTNGTTADAMQMNYNFQNVITCFAPLASPSFTGSVGVGTASPTQNLSVNGAMNVDQAGTNSGTSLDLSFGSGSGEGIGSARVSGINQFGLSFFTSNYIRLSITQIGYVGIGTTTPSYLLHVGSSAASGIVAELQNSSGACTHSPGASSETVSCSSDARLKTNIHDASSTLPWIDGMRIRDFTVKATGEKRTGVVAQELTNNHPDMVHKNAAGFYSVDEPNPWLLVKTLQELHSIVTQQQAEIEQLKAQVAALNTAH